MFLNVNKLYSDLFWSRKEFSLSYAHNKSQNNFILHEYWLYLDNVLPKCYYFYSSRWSIIGKYDNGTSVFSQQIIYI